MMPYCPRCQRPTLTEASSSTTYSHTLVLKCLLCAREYPITLRYLPSWAWPREHVDG